MTQISDNPILQDLKILLDWGIAGPYDEFGVCPDCKAVWHEREHNPKCKYLLVQEIIKKYDATV